MLVDNKFISFFDLLGFSSFIKNNDNSEIEYRIDHLFRDIEYALSKGALNEDKNRMITYDISNTEINCLTISDSIIFWTDTDTIDIFREIIQVTYLFNEFMSNWNFPVRGAIVYGELGIKKWDASNGRNKVYRANSIYGKGLIKAYEIANSLEWCGSVVDDSILSIPHLINDVKDILSPVSVSYPVPTKQGIQNLYSFFLEKPGFNDELLINKSDHIENVIFKGENKTFDKLAEVKLNNTLNFLKFLQNYRN